MPIYEYEHLKKACSEGMIYDVRQALNDKQLTQCPTCKNPVQKIISRTNVNTPKTNSELRDLGFTKLVKRDDGVYENVTARRGESKRMISGKPDTLPDLKKIIKD